MSNIQKIESCPGFVKDMTSGAILNIDSAGLSAYKRQKKLMKNMHSDRERLDRLEDQMGRIETLLNKIVGTLNDGKRS